MVRISFARIALLLFLVFLVPFSLLTLCAIPMVFITGGISGGSGHGFMIVPFLVGSLEWLLARKINATFGKIFGILYVSVVFLTLAIAYWFIIVPLVLITTFAYFLRKAFRNQDSIDHSHTIPK